MNKPSPSKNHFDQLQRLAPAFLLLCCGLLLTFLCYQDAFWGTIVSLIFGAILITLLSEKSRSVAIAVEMAKALALSKHEAEVALREFAALRTVIDQHSIVSITDRQGRIIDANTEFCRVSGYSHSELIGQNHSLLNSGYHPPKFWVSAWKKISSGKTWRGEVCNRAKDRSIYWVDSIICPFFDSDGKIEKYVSIGHDITMRKAAQQEIEASEEKFRAIADGAPLLIWTCRADGKAAYFNEPWLKFTGRDFLKEVFDGWQDNLHPDDRSAFLESFHQFYKDRNGLEIESRMRRHDGEYRLMMFRGSPRFDATGSFEGFVGASFDLTELRDAQFRAESANRSKSAFLANMSHEIRTPLTAILGYANLLQDQGRQIQQEERTEVISTIRRSGEHLLAIINDILDISKIEADKVLLERIVTPIDVILREVEGLFQTASKEKGVSFETRLSTPIPQSMVSDPTRFRQILMNLLGNAIKFTERGQVCLEVHVTSSEKPRIIFDVQDTGVGLDEQQIKALFVPFSQADETVSRKFGGTGLGLTISRRLARIMGGDVLLHRTELGNGSCFRLELPVEVPQGVPWINRLDLIPSTSESILVDVTKLNGRILFAEDGIDNQKLIAFHLRKAGAEVEIAENGLIALQKISESISTGTPYDLLLTDIQMPEMDGYTLASTLRRRGFSIGIIALTAHAMADDRARCLDAGCDDYATKPINKEKLIELCQKWMKRSSEKGTKTSALSTVPNHILSLGGATSSHA